MVIAPCPEGRRALNALPPGPFHLLPWIRRPPATGFPAHQSRHTHGLTRLPPRSACQSDLFSNPSRRTNPRAVLIDRIVPPREASRSPFRRTLRFHPEVSRKDTPSRLPNVQPGPKANPSTQRILAASHLRRAACFPDPGPAVCHPTGPKTHQTSINLAFDRSARRPSDPDSGISKDLRPKTRRTRLGRFTVFSSPGGIATTASQPTNRNRPKAAPVSLAALPGGILAPRLVSQKLQPEDLHP